MALTAYAKFGKDLFYIFQSSDLAFFQEHKEFHCLLQKQVTLSIFVTLHG